ncbi:hypothetical protein LTR10_014306 [Elasticomyces elasticus]|uniref:Uncharacterized protein n=1 Tax=Exophiala sideris TaxID=1016849 RepID=A0ABR0JIQ8_9EURO|nr:hypothetical protein LTR10_014306 [Elasticomyces elasticus]KAK5034348.1 hypothetical protein LTS07_003268 [Exophiala sideris]KAK5042645.1 hypothetical protein LTR13_001492 [Exophiala sideris]KAK5065727.1 hypothetical protein LTR69_003276 [Exophiala sideris]
MRKIPIDGPGGSAPGAGSIQSPTYSVAVTDEMAKAAKAKFDQEVDAKRLFPKNQPTYEPGVIVGGSTGTTSLEVLPSLLRSRAMEENNSANMTDDLNHEEDHQAQIEGETLAPSSSSTSSSSSSGYSPPWRPRAHFELERQMMEEEGNDEDDDEDLDEASTDSEESDEETSEEGDSQDEATLPSILPSRLPTRFAAAGNSDLRSRLQSFLPQLQQANAELDNADVLVEKRIDQVSDDEEHYIEMNLGLGVLGERKRRADDEIRLESSDVEDDDDELEDEDDDATAMRDDVLAHLKGESVSKVKKRKIEDLG